MSNLPISPTIVVPGVQVLEDFPTIGTANYRSDFQKSDFSRTLADVVKIHQSKSKEMVKSIQKDDTNSQTASFNTKSQTAVKINEQNQQQKPTVSTDKKSESKSAEADSQDSTKAETTSEKLIKDSSDKLSKLQDNGKQNTDKADSGIVATMIAPALVEQQQPIIAGIQNKTANLDTITEATLAEATPATNTITNVKTNADVGDVKGNTALGQALDFAAMVNASSQTATEGKSQVIPSVPNIPVTSVLQNAMIQPGVTQNITPSVQQTAATAKFVTSTVAPVQSIQAQNKGITSAIVTPNQMLQNQSTAVNPKTKDVSILKSSELTNGKTVEAQTQIIGLQVEGTINQPSDGTKGIMDNGMLIMDADAVKDNQNSASSEKRASFGDSPVVTQVSDTNGKAYTLNMPVIQTQLSVNNPNDKTRDDIALVTDVPQQQTTEANTDTTKATVNHVNKDDLFEQIIEKAKVSIKNGNGEMEVSLKPDHLGKLHLKVSVDNQLVTAKFMAESQQVKEVIETNLNQLRRNLQDTGIQVDQLMVTVGQQNNDSSFQQASHNSGGFSDHNGSSVMRQEISGSSKEKDSREKPLRRDTVIDLIA